MSSSLFFLKGKLFVFAVGLALSVFLALTLPPVSRATSQSANPVPLRSATQKGEAVAGEILVRFRPGKISSRAQSLITTDGAGREIPINIESFEGSTLVEGLRLARVKPEDTPGALAALRAQPNVIYAEPNYILRAQVLPNDPLFPQQTSLRNSGQFIGGTRTDISAEQAWDITTGSGNVVVGVVDTGIDVSHQDLKDNIWVNPGEIPNDGIDNDNNGFVDDVNGWDFLNNDKTLYDGPGTCTDSNSPSNGQPVDVHGTHVAGIIGASGNNGIGVAGVSWNVKLMPLKFLGPCGSGPTSAAVSALNYAKAMRDRGVNIRVINSSWGGGERSQALLDAINALNDAGVLVVVSAGNDSSNNDATPTYPASFDSPNLISVAATNQLNELTTFSNFGTASVDMGAPGVAVLSTTPGDTYTKLSGTSMAAPHVSGVAALILAANPGITLRQLRAILIYSGDPSNTLLAASAGGRRLNAYSALTSAAENDVTPPGPVTNLRVAQQNGRRVDLLWTASGDDGGVGQAALYDISFVDAATGAETLLKKMLPQPAGSSEGILLNVPYKHSAGSFKIRAYDNVGNEGLAATVSVTVDNAGVYDPYVVTEAAPGGLSTGGTPLNLKGDDSYLGNRALPFSFRFYGSPYPSVTVSTNGALYFSTPPANDSASSPELLSTQRMIAGLWDDLRTDKRPGDDVYMVQPDANRIIFRWQAVTYGTETPVNFEIELRSDGSIITRYGDGNVGLRPVVGISDGEPEPYVASTHSSKTNKINLTNAQAVNFGLQPCSYSLSASSQSFGAALSSSSFKVSAGLSCAWTAESNVSWIGLSYPSQSNPTVIGPATVSYDVAPNNTPAPRTGTITVAGQTYTVTQAGAQCDYALGQTNQSFPGTGGNSSVFVSATSGCAWMATPSANWITITSGGNSSGNGSILYTVAPNTSTSPRAGTITVAGLTLNITQDAGDPANATQLQFGQAFYDVNEGDGRASVPVTRTGDTSVASSVNYATSDQAGLTNCSVVNTIIASSRCDYATTVGTLRFSPGETTKTIFIPLVDDSYFEAGEAFTIRLSNPAGAMLGNPSTTTVIIFDNDRSTGANPIVGVPFFVRQQYIDFLGREPDDSGFQGWQNLLNGCAAGDTSCDRIAVSSGFFRSPEFQDRGSFIFRFYAAALGRNPFYSEFMPDLAKVSGFLSDAQLEANKVALVQEFMTRQEFQTKYGSLSNTAFVDTLIQTAGLTSHPLRDAWIGVLNNETATRAEVLRAFTESLEVYQKFYNQAFVVMQYFGYLRRDPDASYTQWIDTMDRTGDFRGMINGFINSNEYVLRFGP